MTTTKVNATCALANRQSSQQRDSNYFELQQMMRKANIFTEANINELVH